MSPSELTIGELSQRTDCAIPTIRFYEKIALLPVPLRAANGHRYYRESDLKRVTFIKRCRDFGFPIEQVRALSSLFEDNGRACVEVRDLAQSHLDQVHIRLEDMRKLAVTLAAFVASCDATCSSGITKNCTIFDDIVASTCLPDGADNSAPKKPGKPVVAAHRPRQFTATELARK